MRARKKIRARKFFEKRRCSTLSILNSLLFAKLTLTFRLQFIVSRKNDKFFCKRRFANKNKFSNKKFRFQ